jgi:epoxyqueuosine reductase
LYRTVNSLLDQYTWQIAARLNAIGYQSVFVPRDGYGSIEVLKQNPVAFFSHRHAAVLAGLGTFGVNNMVLTSQYGPRVRFGSIFTSAEIPSDPILSEGLCIRCNRCVRLCPTQALEKGEYPDTLTDKKICACHSAELNRHFISPCGICIKVCPIGEDRIQFNRTDPGIYEHEGRRDLDKAWDHVRRYGRK